MSSEDKVALAKKIKAVVFDSDGCFFTNHVFEGAEVGGDQLKLKVRSYYDGQGVSLLRAIGIRVAFVTNEKDANSRALTGVVEKFNKLPSSAKIPGDGGWEHVRLFTGMGGARKLEAAEIFLKEVGATFEECAAMGDDLVDVPLLRKVALSAAPAQAEQVIRDMVHFVTERNGGEGAVRDFANFILEARGIDPRTLPPN
ncbi:MAG: 3-deoxy-D-manno-octulosonate 8-phosphate phosphatase, YrbI family [Parcubacteria group bacterium GW2011_GWA2_51_12]|nr:MAG: 3-deoxy-D-manno-octulosonate 8-phosphate phosphatase, YrbI family [Parcubacteria group bacterium GW2011_GWA2_51_12]